MADITSRDFQELIKRQKETTDRLNTIVEQNVKGDSARERFLDALPEIASDTRLASQREKFDIKEGLTRTDELQEETTQEVTKLGKIQKQGIDETKEQKKESGQLQQQIIEANKKGFLTFGERIKFLGLNLKETLSRSLEDRLDLKRMFKRIGKGLGDIGKSLLGKISSPVVEGFKSISAIAANILKGGAIIAAMFGIQAFINSDMFPKFLKGLEKFANMIVDFGKATFDYISELYAIFQEEGGGFAGLKAVASKLFEDTGELLGDFKKTFLIGIGIAVAAFAAAIYFAISTATSMVRGLGRGLGRLTGGLPTKGAKNVRGGGVRSRSSGFKMGEMNPKKQPIKPGMVDRMGGVKNIARTGARTAIGVAKFAGPVGLAVATAQGVYDAGMAMQNANELFGKEASNFEKLLAGGAGALEGFTFGLLKAEDMIKTPAEIIKSEAEKVKKQQEDHERFVAHQEKRLEKGLITKELHDKLIETDKNQTLMFMRKSNKEIEEQKKVIKQNGEVISKEIKETNKLTEQMISLMEENKKLVSEKENTTANIVTANSTNVQNNNSDKTIVMDTPIVDTFHNGVYRNQFG
tara:strand:- start:1447 stop:3189 length:1743 start_codon:yes stop_codon:yes gene_type:complete